MTTTADIIRTNFATPTPADHKAVDIALKLWDFTVDHADRIPGCYLEDGSVATLTDLRHYVHNHGPKALVALLADNAAIHG